MIFKTKKQKEIRLRQWCVEQARTGDRLSLEAAQECYDWVMDKAHNPSREPSSIRLNS
jgi:hypothetical protein